MKRWLLYILLGLIVFFIWDNSMQTGGSSDGFSLLFAETFAHIVNKLGFHGNIWTLNRIVRKLAHLTEFTILGGVLYTILRRYITYGTVIKTIGLGMLIASLDEFIQRFSPGRSSQFSAKSKLNPSDDPPFCIELSHIKNTISPNRIYSIQRFILLS